jgi:hypothetical protein
MSKYKRTVRKELSCEDTVVANRRAGEAVWRVWIYRKGATEPKAEFELLSTTANLAGIKNFLKDLERNTPPSYRTES